MWGPQHMPNHHTHGLGIGLRKLLDLTLNIQLKLNFFFKAFTHMFSPKANIISFV